LKPGDPPADESEDEGDWAPEDNAPRADLPPFNIFTWSLAIPLLDDDLWLGMQARNLALVDMGLVRKLETNALREYMREEKTGLSLMFLSAISQMWVFALYEFLRTWRERAKHLLKLAEEHQQVQPRKRAKFLEKSVADAKGKEKHVRSAIVVRSEHVARIGDAPFMDGVRTYFDKTDGLFREIEALRVSLAKHEVPGSRGFAAEAPGYARMSIYSGSLYWHYVGKGGGLERSERRELADAFFEIGTTFSEQADADGGDEPPED
jgi:hypothetical protein